MTHLVLAESVTVPLGWLPAVGAAFVAALGLLYRNQRQEAAERHAEVVALTRDVTAALVQNSATLSQLTTCVQTLASKEMKNRD